MKAKDSNGKEINCNDCGKAQTVNECQLHKSSTKCYYCHLLDTHMVEDTPDKEEMKNG